MKLFKTRVKTANGTMITCVEAENHAQAEQVSKTLFGSGFISVEAEAYLDFAKLKGLLKKMGDKELV